MDIRLLKNYLQNGSRWLRRPCVSTDYYTMMHRCWRLSTRDRPTAAELVVTLRNALHKLLDSSNDNFTAPIQREPAFTDYRDPIPAVDTVD